MTVLSKDRNTVRKEGDYAAYPVKANAKIFAGSMVCLGTDGYAVPGADTAGYRFAGVSRGYVDNTGGADGALTVEVWRKGCFGLSAASMAKTNVGDAVYVVDDQTVGLASVTTNDVPCGRISEYVNSTSVFVDIDRI
jgi:hypothetical protein